MPSGIYKRTKNTKTGHHVPWNKGKKGVYKHSPETLAKLVHNGMLGKHHTFATKKKISNGQFGKSYPNREATLKSYKRGWYKIGEKKIFFRSKWEANYALYLEWLKNIKQIKDWSYEKDRFIFHKIQFGNRSYRPDFKIFNNDGSFHYDEVKGWMDSASKTKLKRMKKYYPEITVTVIDGKAYGSIYRKIGKVLHFY